MMPSLRQMMLLPLLFLLALSSAPASADQDDDELWAPTPPRLSHIEGDVSYWREGSDEWVVARPNLALARGDALFTSGRSNLEVQFDHRSFARADEHSQFSLVNQEADYIQFKVTGGLVSFDIRNMTVGDTVEISTPDAVFVIEHPGYYRVEVNSTTHLITRRGGRATVTTADGRSMSIYPSEEIVIRAGNPVQVASYAAPDADEWDRWNDARSDRIGDSVSARYLPAGIYGAEELDYYGNWRVVPSYGPVWIPHGVGRDWVPYSTGTWAWDPYYEWTWIDDAPWGWAPFHYGRWVFIDGYWAWAPGPVARRPVYSPALVAFMIRDGDVSVRLSFGLPGLWWVALSWGEPVHPWWGPHKHRGQPHWAGWGGPRIINNVVSKPGTVVKTHGIRYHNASLPRAVLTVPADKFGRERARVNVETRYRPEHFATVHGNLPIKPSADSLFGGAAKGVKPPRDVQSRKVVSTRPPPKEELPWRDGRPESRSRIIPEAQLVKPPARSERDGQTLPRPSYAPQPGPERPIAPLPPRFNEARPSSAPPPATVREQQTVREQATVRSQRTDRDRDVGQRQERPASWPVWPPGVQPQQQPYGRQPPTAPQETVRTERTPPTDASTRGEIRQEWRSRVLPGQPANQTYKRGDDGKRREGGRDHR